jgi:hypothetical protein
VQGYLHNQVVDEFLRVVVGEGDESMTTPSTTLKQKVLVSPTVTLALLAKEES